MISIKEIDVVEAFEKAQNGVLLVDVRETDEVQTLGYDVEHLLHIPLSVFQEKYTQIPDNQEVVMVCRSGGRSAKATAFLQEVGYTQVSNMQGGILEWSHRGFPVVKG